MNVTSPLLDIDMKTLRTLRDDCQALLDLLESIFDDEAWAIAARADFAITPSDNLKMIALHLNDVLNSSHDFVPNVKKHADALGITFHQVN